MDKNSTGSKSTGNKSSEVAHDTKLVYTIMITCNTIAGRYFIQEHIADAREIGYGFSTLPEFRAEEQVKIRYNKQVLNAQERAVYLQFLKDFGEL